MGRYARGQGHACVHAAGISEAMNVDHGRCNRGGGHPEQGRGAVDDPGFVQFRQALHGGFGSARFEGVTTSERKIRNSVDQGGGQQQNPEHHQKSQPDRWSGGSGWHGSEVDRGQVTVGGCHQADSDQGGIRTVAIQV